MKTSEILELKELSTKEVSLLMRRANNGETIDFSGIWNAPKKITDPDQGLNWLKNLWKTPAGKERKNNPFGYREEEVIETFEHFELAGYYDAGNMYFKYYVPLWNVIGSKGSFQYHMKAGQINIVG